MYLSLAQHKAAAGTFRSSQAPPSLAPSTHPCLLWHTRGPAWRRVFLSSPACVGLGYVDSTYTVRILSAPAIHLPDAGPGCVVGSDGDSALEARPTSLSAVDIFNSVVTFVPRVAPPPVPLPFCHA